MHKVMIVDDMPKHRQQIAAIIQQIPGVEIMACLENGVQVLHWCYNNKDMPDIIVLDVEMPKLDGVGIMECLFDFFDPIKVLAISSHGEKQIINDMLAAGAMGFLWKYNDYPYLKEALQQVLNNEVYIDERLNDGTYNREVLMHKRGLEKDKSREAFALTDREWQIVKIIIAQTNYIEIGIATIRGKLVSTSIAVIQKNC